MNVHELDARKKIINAAAKLFAEQGFNGTSTREIAKSSGANLSLISYYFGGKEGLYKAVLSDFAEECKSLIGALTSEFDTDQLSKESFKQAILSLIDHFFEMRIKNPYLSVILTREKLEGMPHSYEIHAGLFKTVGDKIEALILRAQKKGFINSELIAHYFLSSLVESIIGYFLMHDCCSKLASEICVLPENHEEFKKQMSLIYLEGIFK